LCGAKHKYGAKVKLLHLAPFLLLWLLANGQA